MKLKPSKTTLSLSHGDIGTAVGQIAVFLQEQKLEAKTVLHLQLSTEELLLRWQDHFGTEQELVITTETRFGQPIIWMSVAGEACDPTVAQDELLDWSARLLSELGLAPVYTYRRGVNQLSLKLKRPKRAPVAKVLCAAGSAALLGPLGLTLFPEQAVFLAGAAIQPIRQTLLGLLSAVAIPMIFLSVMLGVCGSGSTSAFSELGNKMISRFLRKLAVYTLLAGIASVPLFHLTASVGRMDTAQFQGALQMLLAILPTNLIDPFLSGNTLQIMVIAVAAGLAVLALGSRANTLRRLAEELNSVVHLLLEAVSSLIPAIVFFVLLETSWGGSLSSLVRLWKPVLVILICCVLLPLTELLLACRQLRIRPRLLLRKIFPTALIALATASSAAAFSTNTECCEKQLGIHRRITGFGVPLGSVVYMPLTSVLFLTCVFFGAEQHAVPCSAIWWLVACLTAALLSIAIPPIPGGAAACYAVMFAQMGIPAEAIVFAVAIEVIVDRFGTAANLAALQLELLLLAEQTNLLDRDALHSAD